MLMSESDDALRALSDAQMTFADACRHPFPDTTDLGIIGFPCQMFSMQGDGAGCVGGVSKVILHEKASCRMSST